MRRPLNGSNPMPKKPDEKEKFLESHGTFHAHPQVYDAVARVFLDGEIGGFAYRGKPRRSYQFFRIDKSVAGGVC